MRIVLSGLALVALFGAMEARADTLRCGSVLIQVGDTAGKVLEKCGDPESRTTYAEPVHTPGLHGAVNVVGTTTYEVWRYKRGSGKFPALLTFEGGELKKIEFER
jgi:hypothetical protein